MNSQGDNGHSEEQQETPKNQGTPGTSPTQDGGTADPVSLGLVNPKDVRRWTSLYAPESKRRQRVEGWILFFAIIAVLVAICVTWRKYEGACCGLGLMAFLGGLLGGLLQDAKFFYKSVGDGNWIWNKSWWRLLTPLLSGAMGFSVYVIFIGFGETKMPAPDKAEYYAYGIGFLTGLFADNAIQKLRDIAYAIFGTPREPQHKLHTTENVAGSQSDTNGKTAQT